MSHRQAVPEGKDPELWEIAEKRACFKPHAMIFVITNIFLWSVWYFSQNGNEGNDNDYLWPVWVTLSWGIWLAFHYAEAYVFPKENSAEQEYEKLINQQK